MGLTTDILNYFLCYFEDRRLVPGLRIILIKWQYNDVLFILADFTILGCLSAYLQKSKRGANCHYWFLINCGRLLKIFFANR